MPSLLTAAALATALGVSKATILRRTRAGLIPVHRLGAKSLRYALADVLAVTAEQQMPAPPHPKVSRLSQEDRDFFLGQRARRGSRSPVGVKKAP